MLTFSRLARVRSPLPRLVVVGASIAALVACSGLTSVDASFDNVSDTLAFYAINGSPPGAPTAVALFARLPYHADQGFAYDLAFDINANGKVVLIPARQLASQFANPYSVGLQVIPGTFAALDRAPKDGYTPDSLLVVGVGALVAIESHDAARCGFAIKGQSYYSKLVVDSVQLPARKIFTTIAVNRNCGFRSFAAGRPKD